MFKHIDTDLFYLINNSISSPLLDCTMPVISFIGKRMTLFILLLILFILGTKRLKLTALIAGATFVIALVSVGCLKQIVARPRPASALSSVNIRENAAHSDSFPSGHTAFSFSIASVISNRHRRTMFTLFILAALIGFSRVYLGVHYPSDVLSGAVLGMFIGAICCRSASPFLQ